jgi:WhiB family redox-sensing transcriptional regulator
MIPTFMLETDIVPLCSKIDPDFFFPVDDPLDDTGDSSKLKIYSDEHLAKAICDGCPLKLPCALYALQTGPQGIWGGTTESERLAIRRGRAVKLQKSLGLAPTKRR